MAYYPVRRLIQHYTDEPLEQHYCSKLLVEYQKIHGPLKGLYYEPRGTLYEPHTGTAMELGTREVDSYNFPPWRYNKILYVEKLGLQPILKASELGERFDLAIVVGGGYPTEACRALFARADKSQRYALFCLHDADIDGYQIARTLREQTQRMPGYSVEVIDLGLKLEEALVMGLQTEEFTRHKALPATLELNQTERQYFEGRQVDRKCWVAQRVELNAMTAPQLVEYVEGKLRQHGAIEKVVPPTEHMVPEGESTLKEAVCQQIVDTLTGLVDMESLEARLAPEIFARLKGDISEERVRSILEANRRWPWDKVVKQQVECQVLDSSSRIRSAVIDALREGLREGQEDGQAHKWGAT
jgi:hypothetical protein